jgi:hypothetical protein
MLSDDQLAALERLYFQERFVPRMIHYLREEGFDDTDERFAMHLGKLHDSLALLRIHSPRNTFRFYRLDRKEPAMRKTDSDYFLRVMFNTSIEETARFDMMEKNILSEDNKERWKDLA